MKLEKIEIIVGFRCNQNCKFCSIKFKNYLKPYQQIVEEIDKAAKQNPYEINFTGGEPTLRKDLPELIRYASEKVKLVRITTNGEMLSYKRYVKKLVESGLGGAIFSIHSSDPKIHDFLTSVNGSWKLCVKGIENLSQYPNQVIGMNTVITKVNYKDLPRLERFLVDNFTFQTHCMIYPTIEGNLIQNLYLLPSYEEVSPYAIKALEVAKSHGVVAWVFNVPACYLPGHERSSSIMEYKTKIYWESEITDLDKKKREGNEKLDACKSCRIRDVCQGIPRIYIKMFGPPKVNPIKREIFY